MNTSAVTELAGQRLSALQLAEALGNVSEACRRRGISRTQFYEYKRRCVSIAEKIITRLNFTRHSMISGTVPPG